MARGAGPNRAKNAGAYGGDGNAPYVERAVTRAARSATSVLRRLFSDLEAALTDTEHDLTQLPTLHPLSASCSAVHLQSYGTWRRLIGVGMKTGRAAVSSRYSSAEKRARGVHHEMRSHLLAASLSSLTSLERRWNAGRPAFRSAVIQSAVIQDVPSRDVVTPLRNHLP